MAGLISDPLLALDLLLALSAALFLLPVNPLLSSFPVVLWLGLQLLLSPARFRWIAFPILFVTLVSGRSWFLNQMPHPFAAQDVFLLVAAFFAGICVEPHRWKWLIRLPLLSLLPLLLLVEAKPWTPNPLAGPNQCAYLLGILALLAFAWFLDVHHTILSKISSAFACLLSLFLIWQTGSRAALLSSLLAALLVWMKRRYENKKLGRELLLLFPAIGLLFAIKQFVSPSSLGIPGIDISSDMGRISIAKCYLMLPFSGSNRFLYGVGFDGPQQFCNNELYGGIPEHAHNIYLQLFAYSGILGILGFFLLIAFIFNQARLSIRSITVLPCSAGILVFIYALMQGLFDISLIHWPVTIIFTGIFVSALLHPTTIRDYQHGSTFVE